MKKNISILIIAMLLLSAVQAQSKRGQKKHQELLAETTMDDGARFFKLKSSNITIMVRRCTRDNTTLTINMLVKNSSKYDDHICFYGNKGEFGYSSWVVNDMNRKLICPSEFLFESATFKNGKYSKDITALFIPAEGAIKVSLKLENYTSSSDNVYELRFGFDSVVTDPFLSPITAIIADLKIDK